MTTQKLPFDADNFSHQARMALGALQDVMQVVINAGALLEQERGAPLDPPAPRRFLYPRDPMKTAKTAATELNQAEDPPAKALLLRELHARPATARFTSEEAALYRNCSLAQLRTWRWQRKGPQFTGSGRNVRYLKKDLDTAIVE